MVKGKITLEIQAENTAKAKKVGFVLKNISTTVSEKDLLKVYDIIQKKPDFFSKVVSKLDSPVVKMALGI